jgi:hypothetical protein
MSCLGVRLPKREETAKGTARLANRSSGMAYHSDQPADQLKLEARRFQESLRRALATAKPNKQTK